MVERMAKIGDMSDGALENALKKYKKLYKAAEDKAEKLKAKKRVLAIREELEKREKEQSGANLPPYLSDSAREKELEKQRKKEERAERLAELKGKGKSSKKSKSRKAVAAAQPVEEQGTEDEEVIEQKKTKGKAKGSSQKPSADRRKSSLPMILIALVVLGALGAGGYFEWKQFGDQVMASMESSGEDSGTSSSPDVGSDDASEGSSYSSLSEGGSSKAESGTSEVATFSGGGAADIPADDGPLAQKFDKKLEGIEVPTDKQCFVWQNELSPVIAVYSSENKITLFDKIGEFGLGGPTGAAYGTGGDIKTAGRGKIQGGELGESWMLFWFSGAKGWDTFKYSKVATKYVKDDRTFAFDLPFLVSFQNKPSSVQVGENGVEFSFPDKVGVIQLLPLLGAKRPDPRDTAKWNSGLPSDIAGLAKAWNARMKFFPAQVREAYSMNPVDDFIDITNAFRLAPVPDEWGTDGVKWAPVSPAVALAMKYGMKLQLSDKHTDTGTPTQFGPTWVVEGSDSYTIRWPGFASLVNTMHVPNIVEGEDEELRKKIEEQALAGRFATNVGWFGSASASIAQGHKASLIPYCSKEAADKIRSAAMQQVASVVWNPSLYKVEVDRDFRRERIVDALNSYGGDSDPIGSEISRGLWDYAFYTGDFYSIEGRWDDLLKVGVNAYYKTDWLTYGRTNTGGDSFHDIIGGAAAMARMAAVLGKSREYGLFSYALARHLINYYGYEYAYGPFAESVKPYFCSINIDEPLVVWDIYAPFGALFTPYSHKAMYGDYTGFFEHYFRIGEGDYGTEGLLETFYKEILPDSHIEKVFSKMMQEKIPNPGENEGSKKALLFYMNARILDWSKEKLEAWCDKIGYNKEKDWVLASMYDAIHPRKAVNFLPEDMNKPHSGPGVQLMTWNTSRHNFFDIDNRSQREPGLFLFGFTVPEKEREVSFHGENGLNFGFISVGEGKIIGRESPEANWVSRGYGFNLSVANAEEQAAAEEQKNVKWAFIGPFGIDKKDVANKEWTLHYEPEKEGKPNFDKVYEGAIATKDSPSYAKPPFKKGEIQKVEWRIVESQNFRIPARLGFNPGSYKFLYTRIKAPKDMKVRVGISSRSWKRVYFNGDVVFEEQERDRGKYTQNPDDLTPDLDMFDAELKEGWNDIMIRMRHAEFWSWCYFRIYNQREQSIPGLDFDPEGK